MPGGKPVPAGLIPTLQQSMDQKTILVGTPEQVAEGVQSFKDLLGVEYLTIYPHLVGDTYAKAKEQMERFATEVLPLVK